MNMIDFNNVSKKFKKGRKFNSLRDTVPNFLKRTFGKRKQELNDNEFWALKDISFKVSRGEVLGIIGPNGAGKSTILKLLFGILAPNAGSMTMNGNVSGLIEVTAGFHPELTGRENIYLNGTIIGMSRKEINKKFDQIVDFSGVGEFIDTPVKRYSSGMYARLGFSVVAHIDPDILLVDEVLAVGDMTFQAKCSQKMRELLKAGATIVLVSHNLSLVESLADRVVLLDSGKAIKEGAPEEIIPLYQETIFARREAELKNALSKRSYKVSVTEAASVSFTNVEIVNDHCPQSGELSGSKDLLVNMSYTAVEKVTQPVFSATVVRSDGVICCSANTKNAGISLDAIFGEGTAHLNFGKLDLAPGIYTIRCSILDNNMIHPYAVSDNTILKIKPGSTKQHIGQGVFLPETEWSINSRGRVTIDN